jgi:predicted DNA-binding transcriptional regulator YafY
MSEERDVPTEQVDRRRKRYSQAQRVLQIYHVLANARAGLTMAQLIERTGVTRRTINRDLAQLQEDHLVRCKDTDDEGRKRWALLPVGPAAGISFTRGELFALCLGCSMLDFARDTELHKSMRGARDKVADRLGSHEFDPEELSNKLYAVPDAPVIGVETEHLDDCLNDVLTAVLNDQQLSMKYPDSSTGEMLDLVVEPMTLAYYRGRLYLLAYSERHGLIRLFAMHRIVETERRRGTRCNRPHGFSPESHFSAQFGIFYGEQATTVRARFAPGASRYARERRWHVSQRCTDLDDGGCQLQWEFPVTPDLRSWLLSFGASVEVLQPAELRQQMADELAAASKQYLAAS